MAMKALNPQRRKLLKGIVAGKTGKQAAIDAGYSPRSAEVLASRIVKEPKVKRTLLALMEKAGLSDKRLLEVHSEMLDASKTVSIIPKKGETEGRDATASSVEFVDVPDWQARGKALEMGYKLKGAFIEKHEVSGPGGGPAMFRILFESPKEKP